MISEQVVQPKDSSSPANIEKKMNEEIKKFYNIARKQKQKKPSPLMAFSPATAILKDLKNKRTFDIVKIKEAMDSKPFCFDFGSGTILVFRYKVHCVDAEMMLYVPAIKSFQKKIHIGKFYEIASKRNFHYEIYEEGLNEWIIYVNRIKNISQVELKIKDRMAWQLINKTKEIKFGFDENWLEKSLPINNNLENLESYFETADDINRNSMLCTPLKILRLEYRQQIELSEKSGSIIKNLEYSALLHNNRVMKLYVPYFLKDIVSNLIEKLLSMNLVINRLKLFHRKDYIGFLWDCTLSGFIFQNKLYEEKLMSIKEGVEFFSGEEADDFITFLQRRNDKKRHYSPVRRNNWRQGGYRANEGQSRRKKYIRQDEPMVYRRKDRKPSY